jgi:hypothetical protein
VRPRHLTAVLLLCSTSAKAVDLGGAVRGWVGAGVDSNPPRDYVSPGNSTTTDGVLQGILNLAGSLSGQRGRIDATYDLGARNFLTQGNEDTVVQSLVVDATLWLPGPFAAVFEGRVRDRRGAQRDYSDLVAEVELEYQPSQLDFRIYGAAHRFIFWDQEDFASSFYAPEAGLFARYRFNRHHSVSVFGDVSFRTFNSDVNVHQPDGTITIDTTMTRHDFFALVGASYSYKGPVNITVSYSYLDSSSNSFGESYSQHRIGLVVGIALPWQLMFLLNGQLRLAQYPDGVYLTPDILVLEDDENQSSISVKMLRPLGEHFEIDVRYAFYYGVLPNNGFVYERHTALIGFGAQF